MKLLNAIFLSFVLLMPIMVSSVVIFQEEDADVSIMRTMGSEEEDERGSKEGKTCGAYFLSFNGYSISIIGTHSSKSIFNADDNRQKNLCLFEVNTPPPNA